MLSESIALHGFESVALDTLYNQSNARGWGFSMFDILQASASKLRFYYSKEDWTISYQDALQLESFCRGRRGSLIDDRRISFEWLDGGHSCFYFHLDKILDDIVL